MHRRIIFFAGVLTLFLSFSLRASTNPTTRPTTVAKTRVLCQPPSPHSNEPVQISIYPDKPVQSATIEYQIVDPGKYIRYTDDAYLKNWQPLPMTPAGDHFSVTLPPELQIHRRLIRYRFKLDSKILPEKKNIAGNFAYFCYDGIGSWKGAIEPKSIDPVRAKVVEYDASVMNSVRPLILIANNKDVEDSTWNLKDRTGRKWVGTVFYNGKVYDHVQFRARGGIFRYDLGKNMWKIEFDKDNPLVFLDDYGVPFSAPRTDLDLNPIIQQAGIGFRGEQGLFESVGFKLFQLAGVPASHTTYLQYRVIDNADEQGKTQYDGDLWGLYLAIETPDSSFIQQHNLPKGNLFKMERGTGPGGGELKAPSPLLPNDNTDLVAFSANIEVPRSKSLLTAILTGAGNTPKVPNQWYRDNIDIPQYYSYRAIVDIIHHYDLSEGKNFYLFHDPTNSKWSVFPWDLDITWGGQSQWGEGMEPFKVAFLDKPEFSLEYNNRMRELRDLLFNPDQTNRLIDSQAALVYTPKQPSFVDIDRALWDYNPHMSSANRHDKPGLYYRKSQPPGGFPGMIAHMKQYVEIRSKWLDSKFSAQENPPKTPVIQYTGPNGFPKDNLTFSCTPFQPADDSTFAAIQWRIARIDDADPKIKSSAHAWEINPLWQSEELKDFTETFKIPYSNLKPGEIYRVRAKVKNSKGVWSHWSDPVEIHWPDK